MTDCVPFSEPQHMVHYAKSNDTGRRGSVAGNESSLLVELCADQIEAALDEALREIDALSRSVLDTARHAGALLNTMGIAEVDCTVAPKPGVSDSRALQQAVQNASSRLQFADRLNQRLSNVSRNLAGLATLLRTAELPITDIIWTAFLEEMRATFTMEQERQMFDEVFAAPALGIGADPAVDETDGPILFDEDLDDGR